MEPRSSMAAKDATKCQKGSAEGSPAQSCSHDRKTKPTVASENIPEGLTDRIMATAFGQSEVTSVLPTLSGPRPILGIDLY